MSARNDHETMTTIAMTTVRPRSVVSRLTHGLVLRHPRRSCPCPFPREEPQVGLICAARLRCSSDWRATADAAGAADASAGSEPTRAATATSARRADAAPVEVSRHRRGRARRQPSALRRVVRGVGRHIGHGPTGRALAALDRAESTMALSRRSMRRPLPRPTGRALAAPGAAGSTAAAAAAACGATRYCRISHRRKSLRRSAAARTPGGAASLNRPQRLRQTTVRRVARHQLFRTSIWSSTMASSMRSSSGC